MNRSIIKRLSIYGIVLLFSFFAFGCGTKEAAQQGSDIQQEESQVEVKKTEMFDLENGTVKLNSGYEMPVVGWVHGHSLMKKQRSLFIRP